MLKKKAITVVTMSVVLATAIGFSVPMKSVYAENTEFAYSEQTLVSTENAALVLNQKTGSNDISLVLEFSKEYDKSVTSFETLITLDNNKINSVTLNWDKEFTKNQCRYTYDEKTGKLKLYVVDNKDLLNDRKITIGNLSLGSDETTDFNSSLVLEELKIVDLQHKNDVLTVDRRTHSIEYTASKLPQTTEKPSTGTPSTEKPSTGTPSTDKPSTGTPSTEKPSTGTPSTEKPSTGTPSTEKPSTGTSNTDKPSTGTSATNRPSNGTSATEQPSTGNSSADGSSIVMVQEITLSTTDETLTVGETLSVTATIAPTNASDKSVVWSSSNPDVATVDNGKIVAISEGITTITVEAQDGSDKKATCHITVVKEESSSLQDSESDEGQDNTDESNNSEMTTESKTGEGATGMITKVLKIVSMIATGLLVSVFVFWIVSVQKVKVSNKSKEKQKNNKKDV